jgi:predicted restriction endonuclease
MSRNRPLEHTQAQRDGRARDYNRCQICGSEDHVEGHHIVDYQFGGSAKLDNIVALCRSHHKAVHRGEIDVLKF